MIEQTFANVWEAREDTPEIIKEMTRRSELMIFLVDYLEKSRLSSTKAALRLGVPVQHISSLRKGKINEVRDAQSRVGQALQGAKQNR